jgi:hypothetical protein
MYVIGDCSFHETVAGGRRCGSGIVTEVHGQKNPATIEGAGHNKSGWVDDFRTAASMHPITLDI